MRKIILCSVVVMVFFFAVQPVFAANPLTKLGRGLTNIVFSPFEYFTNIQKAADRRGAVSGAFEGLLAGTYYMVGRILAGAYDVVTFPVPAPKDYAAIMKPDTVFDAAAEA